jgi:hypothetical protein
MSHQAQPNRLDEIYSMMEQGQLSVRMDPHTLVIWGVAGALLAIFTDMLITDDRFPERWSQAFAVALLVGGALSSAAFFDFRLTRRLWRERDQTLSFVQRQLTRIWWILMGLGVLFTVATMFYGGGYMIFSTWIFLIGLALVIHGLFSQQPLEWYGGMMMLTSVLLLATGSEYRETQWIAAALLGVGLPLLALILRYRLKTWSRMGVLAMGGWALLVIAVAEVGYQTTKTSFDPGAKRIQLVDFVSDKASKEEQIVAFPAGYQVPLYLNWKGNLLRSGELEPIPLQLSRPLEILVKDGMPEGHYRIGSGAWKEINYNFRVRKLNIKALIDKETGPRIDTTLQVEIGE